MDIHVIINSPIQSMCLICWLFTCIVSNYNRNEQSKPCYHTRPITITSLVFVHTDKLTWVNKFSVLAIVSKPTTIYFELCITRRIACFAHLFIDVGFTHRVTESIVKIACIEQQLCPLSPFNVLWLAKSSQYIS